MSRLTAGLATVTVLTVTASGCVTVHGEREVVPSATKAEAAKALTDFLDAYNRADKAYDPALDAGRVTGAFGATTQAGFTVRHTTSPGGNAQHSPLALSDTAYTIPKQAGWPRWFVADADSNRDQDDKGPNDTRWLLLFIRTGPEQVWKLAYLSILGAKDVPAFKADKDGWAEPVRPDDPSLAVAPKDLSADYASYLQSGKPAVFAPGDHTSSWREARQKNAVRSGRISQFLDQPLNDGDFAPLGLRTADGRALVFFSARHFERQTAAKGVRLDISPDEKALLTGRINTSLTREWISNELALVPAKGPVVVTNRIQGLVATKGE
ncbi:hypothetical protein AB0M94_05830 [Streptomyces xanthochromogenes]|uniref:Lipoprotein n=1 Tax=Streptomyces xanthochromogenes TaxID=67384 RepID=A0ABQ2ZTM4_9ACTN|nr:hypothetical protein [Streptomyces xanthochromogenes]GGY25245.1 putative lipoprotein [Streptomyces xanthochromogenes]